MRYRSTVIIPVFNTGIVLREAVESVLKQSNGNNEIIIIDDASTDILTLKTIDEFRFNPVVKIFCHERNKGPGAARNTGIKNALSDIIVPLDGDDMLADGYFEKMMPTFCDPDVAFAYCDVQCFGESDDIWKSATFDAGKIVDYQYICGCSPYRKIVHENVGGYCEQNELHDINEDWDFWMSVCEKGYKGVYVSGGNYLYRRHEMSLSRRPRTSSPAVFQQLLERHKAFITKYRTSKQFLAHGYKEAGFAFLALNKPVDAAKCARKLLVTPSCRIVGIKIILLSLKKFLKI